jgi:hypothetical protein
MKKEDEDLLLYIKTAYIKASKKQLAECPNLLSALAMTPSDAEVREESVLILADVLSEQKAGLSMKSIIVSMAVSGLIFTGGAIASSILAHEGKVLSSIDASKYTYIELTENGKNVWIAAVEAAVKKVKKGDTVRFSDGAVMSNFSSKSLNRTFASVMFVGKAEIASIDEAHSASNPSNAPSVNVLASDPVSNPPVNITTIDPTTECIAQIPLKKELQILNGKILLDGSVNYSFEMLANNNYPSKKEIKAISLWVNEHKRCKELGYEWRTSRYPAAPLALVDKLYSDNIFLAADLYAKKVTYGDFAKGAIKADQEFGVGIAALHEQLRQKQQAEQLQKDAVVQQQQHDAALKLQQAEQQHQDALARQQLEQAQQKQAQQQQAALLQQQQYLYSQQQIQQQRQPQIYIPPRSTQATCGWQGNQWVCNTAPTGIDWGIMLRR